MNNIRLTKKQKQFLELLEKNAGNISKTCKAVNIGRTIFYKWCKQSEHFKKEYENVMENLIDEVESSLMTNIKSGDTIATIFFLKTRGKHRGYIEKQEIEHSMDSKISDWMKQK